MKKNTYLKVQEIRQSRFSLKTKHALGLLSLLAGFCFQVTASDYGADYVHTSMPPIAEDPSDFVNMWDPFSLREPDTGDALLVSAESANVPINVDIFPSNGRQITRDSAGNWFVLVEQDSERLYLGIAAGEHFDSRRPRGGDLMLMELVGDPGEAVFAADGEVSGGGMVIDDLDVLHVVWRDDEGLWYVMARLGDNLRLADSWSRWKLAEAPVHAGDIMLDADGDVAVSFSKGDTVYYRSGVDGVIEVVAGAEASEPLPKRPTGRLRESFLECQDAVMDLAGDGSVWLAFRRDYSIWVTQRTPSGEWLPAELAAREYVLHPSIMVVDGRPLITFQHEGVNSIPFGDDENYLRQRTGGGANLGYATLDESGWRTEAIVYPEEIAVARRGIWGQRKVGRMVPHIEQFGGPALFRDGRGVVWVAWMNTTRRWSYSARWMGEGFGDIQELRGPFNAPSLPVMAEKNAPLGADDVGLLFYAADRVIFDRLKIPSLSTTEDRKILFLDALEVASTSGVELVLNQMEKPIHEPALAPRGEDSRTVWGPRVSKHGDLYVMRYTSPNDDGEGSRSGLAISHDGLRFEMVDALPDGLPEAEVFDEQPLEFFRGKPGSRSPAYVENPDQSDPEKKYMRIQQVGGGRGSYWVEYSPDAKVWEADREVSVVKAMRENARPNFYDPEDPVRPLRVYGRVYTETGRSWGVIWTSDMVNWGGLESLLDVDDPYGTEPAGTRIHHTTPEDDLYTMRGQPYLDSVAGKNEDEIYASSVRSAAGMYFGFYWPGVPGRPLADVGIAVSRDGFNFTRVKNGERIMPLGAPGAFDSGYIFQMYPMVDGDILRVYYRATTGTREGTDGFRHNLTSIGVATIRVNGFTYYTLENGVTDGTVTTIPIDSPAGAGRQLTVNVEGIAKSKDSFAVEVLNVATGEPVQGFSLADCMPVNGDGLAIPISWRGGNTLPAGDIRLRFHLHSPKVKFYSFGFQDS